MKSPGKAILNSGTWHVEASPFVIMKLKRWFTRSQQHKPGTIDIADNDEVCSELMWFAERFKLELEPQAHAALRAAKYHRRMQEFAQVLSGEITPRTFKMALPPRDYQRLAAELALRAGGLLIADDMGLGKTVSSLTMLCDPSTRPALVVTLASLPTQWQREIDRFLPGMLVHVLKKGTPYPLAENVSKRKRRGSEDQVGLLEPRFPDIIISTYHKLAGWADVLAPKIKTLIVDECQELRHGGSKKYCAAQLLGQAASFRVGLSGTPFYNMGGEMWNVVEVLRPSELGDSGEFLREWCGGYSDDVEKGSVKDPAAFGTHLREQAIMLRRTKKDVGLELPPIIKVHHHVESDPDALDAIAGNVAELARIVLRAGVDGLTKRNAAGELDWRLRQATGVAKAPYVADFVKMLLESGCKRLVLFGWHREVYDIWNDKLKDYKPVMFTGTESASQKQKSFEAFTKGDSRVLIMSLRSGAGLDGLQEHCCTVVHGELDWSPGVMEQCNCRLDRPGQLEKVVAYYLVSDTGSDPVVSDVLGVKREQIEGVRNPDGELFEKLESSGNHLRQMAEEYLRQRGEMPIAVPCMPSAQNKGTSARA